MHVTCEHNVRVSPSLYLSSIDSDRDQGTHMTPVRSSCVEHVIANNDKVEGVTWFLNVGEVAYTKDLVPHGFITYPVKVHTASRRSYTDTWK